MLRVRRTWEQVRQANVLFHLFRITSHVCRQFLIGANPMARKLHGSRWAFVLLFRAPLQVPPLHCKHSSQRAETEAGAFAYVGRSSSWHEYSKSVPINAMARFLTRMQVPARSWFMPKIGRNNRNNHSSDLEAPDVIAICCHQLSQRVSDTIYLHKSQKDSWFLTSSSSWAISIYCQTARFTSQTKSS